MKKGLKKQKPRRFSYLRSTSPSSIHAKENSLCLSEFQTFRKQQRPKSPIQAKSNQIHGKITCSNCINHQPAAQNNLQREKPALATQGLLIVTPTQIQLQNKRLRLTKQYTEQLKTQLEQRRKHRQLLQQSQAYLTPLSIPDEIRIRNRTDLNIVNQTIFKNVRTRQLNKSDQKNYQQEFAYSHKPKQLDRSVKLFSKCSRRDASSLISKLKFDDTLQLRRAGKASPLARGALTSRSSNIRFCF